MFKKNLDLAVINIKTSSNNIIINIADLFGNVIYIVSAGTVGFKGSKKKTAFAGQKVAEKILNKLIELKITKIKIYLKGIGKARDISLQILSKLKIIAIFDATKFAFNGCRLPKKRRI
jgi:small subunit ribosomal protein S11